MSDDQKMLSDKSKAEVIEAERNLLEKLVTKAIEQPKTVNVEDRSIHVKGNVEDSTLVPGDENKIETRQFQPSIKQSEKQKPEAGQLYYRLIATVTIVILSFSIVYKFAFMLFPAEAAEKIGYGKSFLFFLCFLVGFITLTRFLTKVHNDIITIRIIIIVLLPLCMMVSAASALYLLEKSPADVIFKIFSISEDEQQDIPSTPNIEMPPLKKMQPVAPGDEEEPCTSETPPHIKAQPVALGDEEKIFTSETPAAAPKSESPVKASDKTITTWLSGKYEKSLIKAHGMEFVFIPPGTFMMGSPENEPGRDSDETPHRVTLTKGFYMQTTEVTQGQWKAVTGNNPSHFKNCGDNCPVEQVSWNDIQEFIKKLNQKGEGTYRLPTQAEWEYAARAGSRTAIYTGSMKIIGERNAPALDLIAWYGGNSGVDYEGGWDSSHWEEKQYDHRRAGTHPVGKKNPNAFGLYDMLGNVWEFCQDWYGNYPSGAVTDPAGPDKGSNRVLRGGSSHSYARYCRAANRTMYDPGKRNNVVGFRLVRP